MKKSIFAAVLMLSIAALVNAGVNPSNTVVGSSHDLSVGGATDGSGQICVFCHTPHNAGDPALPLWSRSLSGKTFNAYVNKDFSEYNLTGGQPGAISKACLGCHDGSIALGYIANGAFNSTAAGANLGNGFHGARDAAGPDIAVGDAMNIGGSAAGNGDLSTTHPIGFAYPGAVANKFKDVAANPKVKLFKEGGTTADQIECATCHEPHNQGAKEDRYFLRASNAASDLCVTCHVK